MPHDGVAALAVPALSPPAVPTPPTRVSVVAAASTLLLMDMDDSSLGTPRPCPAHGRVKQAPAAREDRTRPNRSARCRLYGGLIRTGTADLTGGAVVERESPGEPGSRGGETLSGQAQ